jgi:hypothetical protein
VFGLWGSKRPQLTPQQIGYVIGTGLQQAYANRVLTHDETTLLENIKLEQNIYLREVACLAGSAGIWAIISLLDKSPHQDEVRRGYLDSWRLFGAKSEESGRTAAALGLRAPDYAAAAAGQMMKVPGAIGDDVADKFAYFLAAAKVIDATAPPSNADAATLGRIGLLASLAAHAYFCSAFETASKEFADAGLIQRPR